MTEQDFSEALKEKRVESIGEWTKILAFNPLPSNVIRVKLHAVFEWDDNSSADVSLTLEPK